MYYDSILTTETTGFNQNLVGWPKYGYFIGIAKHDGCLGGLENYEYIFDKRSISYDDMFNMAKWLDENISGKWLIRKYKVGFENSNDAMMYKLTWE